MRPKSDPKLITYKHFRTDPVLVILSDFLGFTATSVFTSSVAESVSLEHTLAFVPLKKVIITRVFAMNQ